MLKYSKKTTTKKPTVLDHCSKIPGTTRQEGRTNIGFGRWSQVKHLNCSKRFGGFLWVTGKVVCFWQRRGGGNCVLLKHVLLLQTCEVSIDTLWVAIEWKWPSYKYNSITHLGHTVLVGSFNPFEKYERQNGSLPQVGVKIKKSLKLPPSVVHTKKNTEGFSWPTKSFSGFWDRDPVKTWRKKHVLTSTSLKT